MNEKNTILMALEMISGSLFLLVFIAGGIACQIRLKSARTREGHLVGLALGMFVIRMLILVVAGVVLSRLFSPPLFEQAQTSRFYASINWWVGFLMELTNSTFYAAAWVFILLAAFGTGSTSKARFLEEDPSA